MCGIAGIIASDLSRKDFLKMLELQSHRGPDNTGVYEDPGFAILGHNRLAIIDLSPSSNQPFLDPSERFILSFNGEIYNYLELKEELKFEYDFKTNSDTEVLLAAYLVYGKDCLIKLNGMFSFAIWDSLKKELFAARDRFGVKPFYYSLKDSQLTFASEIKTLRSGLNIDTPSLKVWANYFAYGTYGEPNETFFEDIFQLSAGHYLNYSEGDLTLTKWYDFAENVENIKISGDLEETKKTYLELLQNSISLRFRADVPVGFNLSGGVDSSLLLALVNKSQNNKHIQAFTFYTGDERYDELFWVKKMISLTTNPLNLVKLEPQEVPLLSKHISFYEDEPFGGIPTLAYSKIFEDARNRNVLVLLDGQGMDEQWAGYDYYATENDAVIQGLEPKISPFKINCLSQMLIDKIDKTNYPRSFKDPLRNKQYRDLFHTKIPRALRFNDRISMAHSTELREPFLDHRLVEFAVAQPKHFKINGNTHKFLLREIIKDLVPKEISYTPKRPLQTPQREWLGMELKIWVEEQLKSLANSQYSSWFNHMEIEKEWQSYLGGENSSSFHIWQWVNFSLLFPD
tara:strand:+ start:149964 stop:151676 length:1713 start_codon:yes stop_codon:yes gene_type:complete